MARLALAALASVFIILAGCASQAAQPPASDTADAAISLCISSCQHALEAKKNLTSGPCLLDPIPQQSDWVCDVAHNPRTDADNLPENQCQYFRRGLSQHFIEVSEGCEVLRAV